MGLRIGSHLRYTTLVALRNLSEHTAQTQKSLERLSTGRRINRAADGPAELSMSEKLRARATSIARERLNIVDDHSKAQVGEAALSETSGLLIRVRELAVQSANGTLGERERGLVAKEAQGLLEEVDRIASVTRFGGSMILDGSAVGVGSGIDASRTGLGLDAIDLATDPDSASDAFAAIDDAIDRVSSQRASLGSDMNLFESRIRQSMVEEENVRAAESRIVDTDYAAETAELAKAQILQQTSIAVLAQDRVQDELVLKLITATVDDRPA